MQLVKASEFWEGTATDCLTALNAIVGDELVRSRYWPKAANALTRNLKTIRANLRALGISIEFGSDNDNCSAYTIRNTRLSSNSSPEPPDLQDDWEYGVSDAGDTGDTGGNWDESSYDDEHEEF